MQETTRGQAPGHEGISEDVAEGEAGKGKTALSLVERVEAKQNRRVRSTSLRDSDQNITPMLAKVFEQIEELKR